ncbi:hypothetical protein [Moorena sp. SIO4G3]|uniref:hypothetical protein n=1 Tax=Moorena sp. SIO4G3 TaxID=2607821 RepID=UPI00142CD7A7|nr:hypothetical protein [Moorena sp. SIO4G3]NEO80118.1 hypothetical protein [Moorena sp. SIO4G3]
MISKEKDQVQFIQFHQPALESGDYHLKVEQTLAYNENHTDLKTYGRELTFTVQGERFEPLSPNSIYAVFPPSESLGDHSNVLPHITVKRSTLPWERYPGLEDENLPWLILLLFRDSDFEDEADKPKPKTITLGQLLDGEDNIFFPTDTELQLGQKREDLVTVIDVKKKYVKDSLPTHDDLAYLAHVRKASSSDPILEQEFLPFRNEYATIISNRLPEPDGLSIVHLVSIEGRYTDDGFNFIGAGDDNLIRFVSLASWSFSCVDPNQSFTQLLQRLNRQPCTPRLPESNNPQAEDYLAKGYITVPHGLRKGSKTISWYRGPLNTGYNTETYDQFPVKAADELLRYDSEIAMFDISYAAAWQLGRMLMLENQRLAIELYNWKRQHSQNLKALEQLVSNLPLISRRVDKPINFIPPNLKEWFNGVELLKGIPFNYLVPDERLLPPESIRFFWVDPLWIDCLQDGAFSIGRVTGADVVDDRQIRSNRDFNLNQDRRITGIIMRSKVVSGWPGLLVDGYDTPVADVDSIDETEANILPLLRMETLAEDVLICLFQGEVKTVDIHLEPESMHFGLDAPIVESPEWSKNLRNENGELMDEFLISPIPWQNEEKGVINLEELAQQMNDYLELDQFTSAQFGLQMIEGVQKVRFVYQE